jgi:AcrR family transcriptional regulator
MSGKPRTLEFWDARREGLLRAAQAEIAEAGVEGLTLERVARRAGVSKGAVQYAFGSKDQLLGELAHDNLYRIYSDGIATTPPDDGPLDLVELIDALSRGLASDEDRLVTLVAVFGMARRSEATRDALSNFYTQTDTAIAKALLDAGIEVADDDALARLVRGTRGAVLGMFVHWVVHPQDRTLDDVAGEVREMLTRLLVTEEPAGAV